jgi:hypothetical protein
MGDKTWGNRVATDILCTHRGLRLCNTLHCYESVDWRETFIVLCIEDEKLRSLNVNSLQGSYYAVCVC